MTKLSASIAAWALAVGVSLWAGNTLAAEDPQQTIAALQAALKESMEQTQAVQARAIDRAAQVAVEIAALRKKIEELTPKPEAKPAK